jgi:hypothetical protein
MRLLQTRRICLPVVAGLAIAALPTAASAARSGHPAPAVERQQAQPAGDVVDRTKAMSAKVAEVAKRPAKTRAATKPHR